MRGEVSRYLLYAYSTYSTARYPGTNDSCKSSQLVQLTNAATSTGTSNIRTLPDCLVKPIRCLPKSSRPRSLGPRLSRPARQPALPVLSQTVQFWARGFQIVYNGSNNVQRRRHHHHDLNSSFTLDTTTTSRQGGALSQSNLFSSDARFSFLDLGDPAHPRYLKRASSASSTLDSLSHWSARCICPDRGPRTKTGHLVQTQHSPSKSPHLPHHRGRRPTFSSYDFVPCLLRCMAHSHARPVGHVIASPGQVPASFSQKAKADKTDPELELWPPCSRSHMPIRQYACAYASTCHRLPSLCALHSPRFGVRVMCLSFF